MGVLEKKQVLSLPRSESIDHLVPNLLLIKPVSVMLHSQYSGKLSLNYFLPSSLKVYMVLLFALLHL